MSTSEPPIEILLQELETTLDELREHIHGLEAMRRELELVHATAHVVSRLEQALLLIRRIQYLEQEPTDRMPHFLRELEQSLLRLQLVVSPPGTGLLSNIPLSAADRVRLLSILNQHFDAVELQELCFQLGVVYDDLAGANRRAKARALVEHMERRGRLPELELHLRRLRPRAFSGSG